MKFKLNKKQKEKLKKSWGYAKAGFKAADRFTQGASEGIDNALGYEKPMQRMKRVPMNKQMMLKKKVQTRGGQLVDLF